MAKNIVNAHFTKGKMFITRPIFQWSYGQILRLKDFDLPEYYEVHFSNDPEAGDALIIIGDAEGVAIPDEYLTTGNDVYAWLMYHTGTEDGETIFKIRIPVIRRAKPSDGEPTPEEKSVISQAIALLNAAIERLAELRKWVVTHFVQKDGDKVLSDNNYSDEDKAKVDSIIDVDIDIATDAEVDEMLDEVFHTKENGDETDTASDPESL